MKNNKFKVGDSVQIIDCDYAQNTGRVGAKAKIIPHTKGNSYDYLLQFEDGEIGYYNEDEMILITPQINKTVNENSLIINTPTFNAEELSCGSLIYVNKGYLQLQGFIAYLSPKVLTIGYYDEESEDLKCSLETIDVERVVSGEYTVELIRKAIPLELQGA